MKTRKVVIIGAGHVGSHVALGLIQSGEADDIVLIDILKDKAAAQALAELYAGMTPLYAPVNTTNLTMPILWLLRSGAAANPAKHALICSMIPSAWQTK